MVTRSGGRKASQVLISEHLDSETRLHIADDLFLTELFHQAPHLKRVHLRRPPLIVASIISVCVISALALFYFGMPGLSRALANLVPVSWETGIGDALITDVLDDHSACSTGEGDAALDHIMGSLASVSGSDRTYNVRVVNWSMKNAFAAPGGHIVIMSGLLADMESPDELAGVLAHEMAHTIKRHSMTRLIQLLGLDAVLAAMGVSGTNVVDLAAQVGGMLVIFSNSREDEREADEMAEEMLIAANIDPEAISIFFARLMASNPLEAEQPDSVVNIFSTHPNMAERIDAIETMQSDSFSPALDAAAWAALKGICGTAEEEEID